MGQIRCSSRCSGNHYRDRYHTLIDKIVLTLQFVALASMLIAWVLYRKTHKASKALFKIEKVTFYPDNNTVYYILRRGLFSRWKVWEAEPGLRGYQDFDEAQTVLEKLLDSNGIEMTVSETVKEYGK